MCLRNDICALVMSNLSFQRETPGTGRLSVRFNLLFNINCSSVFENEKPDSNLWEMFWGVNETTATPTTLLLVLPGHTLGSCKTNHLDKRCVFSSHEQSASWEKLLSCANSGVQNSLFLISRNSVRNLHKAILDVVLRFVFFVPI